MGRNTMRIITILGIICIAGIAVVQIYWFRKAFDLHEKQFTHRSTIALNRVANQLLEHTNDSTARLESIRQLTTNYFTVEFNGPINPELLEEALYNEFSNQEIGLEFRYGIFECYSDSFIYGNYIEDFQDVKRVRYTPSSDENFYFGVSFPQKSSFIASQMRIWLVFTVLLLAVIFFFAYALFVIFRQKRLGEIKTDFINNMTHELKTPLATISASSEVLMKRDQMASDRVTTYASIINQESKRLKQQIESVLKISVLDSGNLKLQKKVVSLTDIVSRVIRTFEPIVEARNGILESHLCDEALELHGDPEHLENVFHNLIENGIKYSGEKPHIVLASEVVDSGAVIRVTDHGIGIAADMQGKVFEKFFRVPKGDVHDVKGFGLGLYYVNKIIKAHGGRIKLESTEDEGSTFTIELPLNDQ